MTTSSLDSAAALTHDLAAAEDAAVSRFTAFGCRALDLVLASLLFVILLPLLAIVAIAIRLDSPGRVVFRQGRLGRHLEPFTLNKFRSMRRDVEPDAHREFVLGLIAGVSPHETNQSMFKLTADDRVTRVGGFLRRSSLDELPQLWNVIRGEMSLVGPRPPIPYEVENYPAHWFPRFAVRPGLTGLWQVSGRSQLTLEEMIALDVEYVRRRSVWLNVKILFRTIPVVLGGAGAA